MFDPLEYRDQSGPDLENFVRFELLTSKLPQRAEFPDLQKQTFKKIYQKMAWAPKSPKRETESKRLNVLRKYD